MYRYYSRIESEERMNKWGAEKKPFYFIIDYKAENTLLFPQDVLEETGIKFSMNENLSKKPKSRYTLKFKPIDFDEYLTAFNRVMGEIKRGNSFLTNLTLKTKITPDMSLEEIYDTSQARYKLLIPDKFVVFSPETFVKISRGKVFAYPMKGTIDASLPNAEQVILNNAKEKAEHATIVDLIRNDLSIYAKDVKVSRFRYIDTIHSGNGALLQVSSEIKGSLHKNYLSELGSILFSMLPAGSICGAPKEKTLEIIEKSEQYKRDFYTGVAGYFDGESLESFVMIRFIERDSKNSYYYKSGGGITHMSDAREEYDEMLKKIYVPTS